MAAEEEDTARFELAGIDPATQSPDGRVVSARISGRVECPPINISRLQASRFK